MLYPQDAIRIREMKKDKEGSLAGDFAKNLPGMFSDPLPNVFLLRTLEFVLTMFEEMMLRKFWNNGLPISKQNDNTNNSKSDHVVFDHTADSLQCSPRSQFNTFASQNVPLNPLMGQTVTMMSFPKKTAIHTITFVKTYLDKVELKNQEGFHQTTLFKSV
ncbi:hypothetical protein PHYBLDRAFT_165081 [Phycomyces blakesleeanus NRRL 1555(-)]|uniref:Uncharacterized protein n=1 Tax=Phycomyces blakesleeanus (strain ATCC 8743b / DSM 1359 / FGSC 10004 / NBRC 33097 / NRRL 1555) TaxID=763407 RepID=A0A162UNC4_PHYB8|nr:hypothetical protein PHYBLDRAFT_165081 [Phycomyces blakesleeanus NRRL 1555(-)]OAD76553.1 hypothetical protein PHYBLDRAFT_165081 [Phycomyces blakesleeanus NRRL 1555(-)]|eukprot:XP_018294593.1 hypothetical protein PHYBLDRAFT_165081 [Phycomyces blakesleeanus NRRL 1555(-)]